MAALKVNGVVCALALKHTAVAEVAFVMVGVALTASVNVLAVLVHKLAFLTVKLPV